MNEKESYLRSEAATALKHLSADFEKMAKDCPDDWKLEMDLFDHAGRLFLDATRKGWLKNWPKSTTILDWFDSIVEMGGKKAVEVHCPENAFHAVPLNTDLPLYDPYALNEGIAAANRERSIQHLRMHQVRKLRLAAAKCRLLAGALMDQEVPDEEMSFAQIVQKHDVMKSSLSKAANLSSDKPNYLRSVKRGGERFVRVSDLEPWLRGHRARQEEYHLSHPNGQGQKRKQSLRTLLTKTHK